MNARSLRNQQLQTEQKQLIAAQHELDKYIAKIDEAINVLKVEALQIAAHSGSNPTQDHHKAAGHHTRRQEQQTQQPTTSQGSAQHRATAAPELLAATINSQQLDLDVAKTQSLSDEEEESDS